MTNITDDAFKANTLESQLQTFTSLFTQIAVGGNGNPLSFDNQKILRDYIQKHGNVTASAAWNIVGFLFSILYMYRDAFEKYVERKTKSSILTKKLFLTKKKADFEMRLDASTTRKHLTTLKELGFIDYRPQPSITLVKPLIENIFNAYMEEKDIFLKEREENVNKTKTTNNKTKLRYQSFNDEQKEIISARRLKGEERAKRTEEIAEKYNHTVDDIFLIDNLITLYGHLYNYGLIKLADYNTVRLYMGGKDFKFTAEWKEILIKTTEDKEEMFKDISSWKWIRAAKYHIGTRIKYAMENVRSPHTHIEFKKSNEKKTDVSEVKEDVKKENNPRRKGIFDQAMAV